jgi:UDP-glucose 4-epimerase
MLCSFDGVIHFAGLKFPAESYADPLQYYDCNVNGSISLLKVMEKHGVKTVCYIFLFYFIACFV